MENLMEQQQMMVKILNLVMPMCSLIECSSNYFETTGSLWFSSNSKAPNYNSDIANTNTFKSFKYKAK